MGHICCCGHRHGSGNIDDSHYSAIQAHPDIVTVITVDVGVDAKLIDARTPDPILIFSPHPAVHEPDEDDVAVVAAPVPAPVPVPVPVNASVSYHSMAVIGTHTSLEAQLWIVLCNQVYNITEFVAQGLHPSNADFIWRWVGKDATLAFAFANHSAMAKKMLSKYHIGELARDERVVPSSATAVAALAGSIERIDYSAIQARSSGTLGLSMHSIAGACYSTDRESECESEREREEEKKEKESLIRVTHIFIFPVKSCRGLALSQCRLSDSGLENDRIYAFYNSRTMQIINQRTHPLLCKIQPSVLPRSMRSMPETEDDCSEDDSENEDVGAATATTATQPVLNENDFSHGIQLQLIGDPASNMVVPRVDNEKSWTEVHWVSSSKPFLGCDQGDEIAAWITTYLMKHYPHEQSSVVAATKKRHLLFRLIRIDSARTQRTVEPYFCLPFLEPKQQKIASVQNYAAVNLASQESLNEVNRRHAVNVNSKSKLKKQQRAGDEDEDADADADVSIADAGGWDWDRLRVNVVIAGVCDPHFEDYMKSVSIGDEIQLLWSRRRYFCSVPDTNQSTGVFDAELRDTLHPYRNAITLNDRGAKPGDNAVFFGSLYIIKEGGCVRIHSEVRSEHNMINDISRDVRGKSYFGLTAVDIADSHLALNYLREYRMYDLIEKTQVNHDCFLFRWALAGAKLRVVDNSRQSLDLHLNLNAQPGYHWLLKLELAEAEAEAGDTDTTAQQSQSQSQSMVVRAYTPILYANTNHEHFDLLIKIYDHGKMTQALHKMQVGDQMLCKQSMGEIRYVERGKFEIGNPEIRMFNNCAMEVKHINMIVGGSGITPVYQILTNVHLNAGDATAIACIVSNRTEQDILLKAELDAINQHTECIRIHFTLTAVDIDINDWSGDTGYIDQRMIEKYLYKQSTDEDCITLMCGPQRMMTKMEELMIAFGFKPEHIHQF